MLIKSGMSTNMLSATLRWGGLLVKSKASCRSQTGMKAEIGRGRAVFRVCHCRRKRSFDKTLFQGVVTVSIRQPSSAAAGRVPGMDGGLRPHGQRPRRADPTYGGRKRPGVVDVRAIWQSRPADHHHGAVACGCRKQATRVRLMGFWACTGGAAKARRKRNGRSTRATSQRERKDGSEERHSDRQRGRRRCGRRDAAFRGGTSRIRC